MMNGAIRTQQVLKHILAARHMRTCTSHPKSLVLSRLRVLCSVAKPIKAYTHRHSLQSFSLSVEEKSDSTKKGEESDSEEQAKGIDSRTSSMSQPQRVALFPGMDPSALKVRGL